MAQLMLVANPAASQFTGGDHRSIVRYLSRRHLVEAVWPNSAADARTIATDAVTAGFDGVVAMGGDGIVHQIAQALVGTDVFLGIIPAGTTNVLARQLGVPRRPTRAMRYLASPDLRSCPVVTVTTTSGDGSQRTDHAVFTLGMGMDADVVAAAEAEPYRKYRFGAFHYARTSIRLLWSDIRKRKPGLEVRAGARSRRGIGVMAQFHPAFTYFGRLPLRFDRTSPDPMSLLLIERLPMRRVPSVLYQLTSRSGSLATVNGLEVWHRVHEFTATSVEPTRLELDGEVIGDVTSAVARYRPRALWVATPKTPAGTVSGPADDPALPAPDSAP